MDLSTIAQESRKKGIELVATGDCLHPHWLGEIKNFSQGEGVFKIGDTYFVLTVEVEDKNQVHHLILLPEVSKAEELREALAPHSNNLDGDGRPKVNLTGVEIAEAVVEACGLIGPSHAFTPWTALYAYHDSLEECYQDLTGKIYFLELGLSADTRYADRIQELRCLTFLSNSDAHSPNLNKLAREFNRFEMEEISYPELEMAIIRRRGRRPVLNVGFYPEEGKYNETACIRCLVHYTLQESIIQGWRCPRCGGLIKKGVRDRVEELADTHQPQHPAHRPPYLHIIPLSEIITKALGFKSLDTKTVKEAWNTLTTTFGSEIKVLIDAELDTLARINPKIASAIKVFREGRVTIKPGGGGQYGSIELPPPSEGQKSLTDFGCRRV